MTEKKKEYKFKCEHCGEIVDNISGVASGGKAKYSIVPDGKGDVDYEYYDHDFDEHENYCPKCYKWMDPDEDMVVVDESGNVIPSAEDD